DVADAQSEEGLPGRVGWMGPRRDGRIDLRARARPGVDRPAAKTPHRRLPGYGRVLRQHPPGPVPARLGALDDMGTHQRSHRPCARADADTSLLLALHVTVQA